MFIYIGYSFLGGFVVMLIGAVWNTIIGKKVMKY